jgi:hypothetical protein
MSPNAAQWLESHLAGVGELADAERTTSGIERQGVAGSVGEIDGSGFDEGRLLLSLFCAVSSGFLGSGFGECDAVDRQEAEVAQDALVMCAAGLRLRTRSLVCT